MISTGGGELKKTISSIQEMEAKKLEYDWLETQRQIMKDPTKRRNNIFMQARREESYNEEQ